MIVDALQNNVCIPLRQTEHVGLTSARREEYRNRVIGVREAEMCRSGSAKLAYPSCDLFIHK